VGLFEGEKRFDIVVRLNNDQKKDLVDVQKWLVEARKRNADRFSKLSKIVKLSVSPAM
jgi:Cu/Ag efflux pump CusA